jgi:hypothetical protein
MLILEAPPTVEVPMNANLMSQNEVIMIPYLS